MNIVEKPWEKENLGVNSIEFIFDRNEDIESLDSKVFCDQSYDYKVARVPAGRMEISWYLQSIGYKMAETTLEMICDLNQFSLCDMFKKYIHFFDYKVADESCMKEILCEIRNGIYEFDRVALDPVFGKEKSAKRIINWLKSAVVCGDTKAYIVRWQEKDIGYFAIKDVDQYESSSIQAGLFDKKNMGGLGFATICFPILEAKEQGKQIITAAVSSNNVISVRTHLKLGYELRDLRYVYVKHD